MPLLSGVEFGFGYSVYRRSFERSRRRRRERVSDEGSKAKCTRSKWQLNRMMGALQATRSGSRIPSAIYVRHPTHHLPSCVVTIRSIVMVMYL